jgi:WD40 repeat protein
MAAEMIGEYRGAISPDGTAMIMIVKDGRGKLVDLPTMKVAKEFTMTGAEEINKVALSADKTIFACARRGGVLSVATMEELIPVAEFGLATTQAVRTLIFSRNGRWLAGRDVSGVFQFWSLGERPREMTEWRDRLHAVTGICFSPDDRTLACGHFDGSISLWNVETGQRLAKLQGHKKAVLQLAFSEDGRQIGSTSHDASARVWDVHTQSQLASFEDSQQKFYRVSFSPDGTRLLVNEFEDTIIFDIAAQRQIVRIKSYTPYFIDDDTLLGMGRDELWLLRPPKLADIDARESK